MSERSNYTVEIIPETMDDSGDIVPAREILLQPMSKADAHQELSDTHPEFLPKPGIDYDPNPGPTSNLADRDKDLLDTLDAVGHARMAQGRANNRYNRVQIAENMKKKDLTATDVNSDGEAMLPEHLGHAQRVFAKLMGFEALRAAGFDTTGLPNLNQFMETYFGGNLAQVRNKKLRRAINRRRAG